MAGIEDVVRVTKQQNQKLDEVQKRLNFICHKTAQLEKIVGQLFVIFCRANGIQVKVEKKGEGGGNIIVPKLRPKGNITNE